MTQLSLSFFVILQIILIIAAYVISNSNIVVDINTLSPSSANVTVALDGTENYTSIVAAVSVVPRKNMYIYTIYIKRGVYKESVHIDREKLNVIMVGDGINATIITYNKSNMSGYGTMDSATFDISSSWFLARDISFVNSAGTNEGPAMAVRTYGDYIAFYRCSIEGHQDVLMLANGVNQFFYECYIYGTTDFIFGDASVIFQNSFIYARIPESGHGNVITASGRENITKNSGILIHNCTITSAPEFVRYKSTVKTHLGRPWKKYARTIIMETFLDDLIDPEGWTPFENTSDLAALYYAEYANHGPRASLGGRVKWPGYHVIKDNNGVRNFTVENYITGSKWLPRFGVPFIPGLIG